MRTLRRSHVLAIALAISAPAMTAPPSPAAAQAYLDVAITAPAPPPPLPYYEQPPIPGPDYLWTPGYWAWDDFEYAYYWVPGTWVMAPEPGLLWTPGYWGWSDGVYLFHTGYWGPHVGFYGGVAYGFGYTGFGYQGGYWNHGSFFYNTNVNRVTNVNITNVYNQTVVMNRTTINNISYNGGPGGVVARPTAQEAAFQREPHFTPTPMQQQHQRMAASTPALFAKANGGHPAIAATARPAAFSGQGVVPARGARPFSAQPGPSGGRGGFEGGTFQQRPYEPQTPYAHPGAYEGGDPVRSTVQGYPAIGERAAASRNGYGETPDGYGSRPSPPSTRTAPYGGGRPVYPGDAMAGEPREYRGFPADRSPTPGPGFDRGPANFREVASHPPAAQPNGFGAPRQPAFRAPPRPPAPPRPHAPPPPKRDR